MTDPTISLGIASVITAIFGYWISKRGDDTKRLESMQKSMVDGYESRVKSLEKEVVALKAELQVTRENEQRCTQNTFALLEELASLRTRLEMMETAIIEQNPGLGT